MVLKNVEVWLLLLCVGYSSAADVYLQIPDGQLRGYTMSTVYGTTFYAFQGIPYAQPPINELRFQAPRPAQPWSGVRDATYDRDMCYQVQQNYPNENEDCLFINVNTPRNPATNSSLPVMVWMYGGAFLDGWSDSNYFAPHHFMDRDVLLVTFNYRVGPFGFFSSGDSAIPGNAGLKDQNLALQWVQKNIRYFGGDPTKVTIFGESAGAASVGYHILSPKSAGLFRGAILESGSSITPWAYQRNHVNILYQTAALIDPNTGFLTTTQLAQFLLTIPAQQLKQASLKIVQTETTENIQIQQGFFYAPVVEYNHADAFITNMMYESFESGNYNKVPILIGMNSGEAVFFTDSQDGMAWNAQVFDGNHALLDPQDLHIQDQQTQLTAGTAIKNLYAPYTTLAQNTTNLLEYFNDQCFMRSIIRHAEIQSASTDVYFYQFSYFGVIGGYASYPVQGFSNQVRHAEELNYIFAHNYFGSNSTDLSIYPESDALVVRRFVTFFTNFATTLNPTPEADQLLENIIWPKVDAASFPYLDIGSYSQVRMQPRQSTYNGWKTVYTQYGQRPFDTY